MRTRMVEFPKPVRRLQVAVRVIKALARTRECE
jgi:hypothetical protein